MKRIKAWLAVGVVMGMGTLASGQQPVQLPTPYGPPGGFGFPGYPAPPGQPYVVPPSAPPGPLAPLPPGAPYPPRGPYTTIPGAPYGPTVPLAPLPPGAGYGPLANPFPAPMPPDPRLPVGQRPPSVPPVYNGGGPKPGAGEPYLVTPDSPARTPQQLPDSKPGSDATAPFDRFVEYVTSSPSEPYTMYEGTRYGAEARQDHRNVWIQANYIHWWVRGDNAPPLVTTGDPTNPFAGTLGLPDTRVLLEGSLEPNELNGVQATLGTWLDPERLQSLEISGFWLGRASRQYRFGSDAGGTPALGQPVVINGAEGALLFAQPGIFSGAFVANAPLSFHGFEVNFGRNVMRLNGFTLDTLVGARYLYLNDSLSINQNVTVLPAAAGFIPFLGVPQPAGSNFIFNDSFEMTNRFYGGTVGVRLNYVCCRFDFNAVFKVSLGATHTIRDVNGSTTLIVGGNVNTVPGGSLVQASNAGRVSNTDFSVVPEMTLTAGFQVTPNIKLMVGYTALDWNRIQRAGDQVDRTIDFTQVPTSPTFTPGAVGARPAYSAHRTDFWAQGINVGLELKF